MTHHITPPPELVQEWWADFNGAFYEFEAITANVFQAGADQELEACCEWVEDYAECGHSLRLARRPQPPTLKKQALAALSRADKDALTNPLTGKVVDLRTILSKEQSDTIRKALEALPND
jgi:hypothetical protein